MATPIRFTVTATAFHHAARELGVDVRGYTCDRVPSSTRTDGGEDTRGLRATLELIDAARAEIGITATDEYGRWRARAASDGLDAIIVERQRDELIVTSLPVPGWERAVAALLPPLHRAPGESVHTVLDGGEERQVRPAHGAPLGHLPGSPGGTTLEDIRRVWRRPRTGQGHFVIDADRQSRGTLRWISTEHGSYATAAAEVGTRRLSYIPIDNNDLGDLLRERTRPEPSISDRVRDRARNS